MTVGIGIQEMGGRPVNQPAHALVPIVSIARRPSVLDTQYRLGTVWIVDEVGASKGEIWILSQFRGRTPIWQRLGVADPQVAISQIRTEEGTAAAAADNSLTLQGDTELHQHAATIAFEAENDKIIARIKAASSAYESHEHNAGACSFDKQSFCVDAKGFVRFKGDKISIRKIVDGDNDEAGPDGLGILKLKGSSELFHGEHHIVPQCADGEIKLGMKAAELSSEPIAKRAGAASFQEGHFKVTEGHVSIDDGVVWGISSVSCQTGTAEHAKGHLHIRGDASVGTSGYGDTVSINIKRSTLAQAIDGADTSGLITPQVLRELFLRPHPIGSITPNEVTATNVTCTNLLPGSSGSVGSAERPFEMMYTRGITIGSEKWNQLGSYEVGYWVPELSQVGVEYTYSKQEGRYTKMGELIDLQGFIEVDRAKGSPLSPIYLIGLPYPVGPDSRIGSDWTVEAGSRDCIGGQPRHGSLQTLGIRSMLENEELIFVLQSGNKIFYRAKYRTDIR